MVTLRIPVPSATVWTNLLGVLGLVAVVVAVGALAGWPWALLAAGVMAVSLAVLAQAQGSTAAVRDAGAEVRPLRQAG